MASPKKEAVESTKKTATVAAKKTAAVKAAPEKPVAKKPANAKSVSTSTKTPAKALAASKAKSKTSATEKIVFDPSADRATVAQQALANPAVLLTLVENLSTEARRIRQFSASAIGVISETNPEALVPHAAHIVDALHRPEAQTRWECLEALTRFVPMAPDSCVDALIGAEGSLYDEESGSARLAAVRFLCVYGAIDADRSDRVWPLLDEAIQCYHGDAEFQDMLISVISFAGGSISKDVKKSLASRMDFDANNAKGVLQRRAAQIIDLCKKK